MPENLSGFQEGERNRDLQLVSGRNVVLNYGSGAFDRSSKFHTTWTVKFMVDFLLPTLLG